MEQIGGVDPWCLYSRKVSSSLFFFFMYITHIAEQTSFSLTRTFLPSVKKVEYSSIVEQHHALVLLDLAFPLYQLQQSPWKLDRNLLADECFCEMTSQKIDDFLNFNKKDYISPSLLWETLKAVIRGEIIVHPAKINRMKRINQEKLIKTVSMVDDQYSVSPSPEIYKRKLDLQT